MSDKLRTSLEDCFQNLPDPRVEGRCDHKLMDIIVIAILGVICGADSCVDIELYGNAKREWLATFLDLKNGIPSHDTFGRVFRWPDAQQFQAQFIAWSISNLAQIHHGCIWSAWSTVPTC